MAVDEKFRIKKTYHIIILTYYILTYYIFTRGPVYKLCVWIGSLVAAINYWKFLPENNQLRTKKVRIYKTAKGLWI